MPVSGDTLQARDVMKVYEIGQWQSLPQRHVAPHRQPSLRPFSTRSQPQPQAAPGQDSQPQTFALFDIFSSSTGDPVSAFESITRGPSPHYTGIRRIGSLLWPLY
jgi:hypothetical protein